MKNRRLKEIMYHQIQKGHMEKDRGLWEKALWENMKEKFRIQDH